MVDEAVAQVSGCGIDKSVKLMQQLGEKFGLDFFNRLMVYFETESGVSMLPLNKVSIAIADGTLKEDTLVYNPLVQTKNDLTNKWKIQLIDSWLGNKLPKAV
jgi:hypothetical protein